MQILIDVPDNQVSAVMEFLYSVPNVKTQPKNRQENVRTEDDSDVPWEGYWDGREDERPQAVIGSGKGMGWIADDFDAPMEGYWDGREEERPQAVIGRCKGMGWIADDFDAPLEDMKEYME